MTLILMGQIFRRHGMDSTFKEMAEEIKRTGELVLYCPHLDPLTDREIANEISFGRAAMAEKPQPEGFILTLVACNTCMAKADEAEKQLKLQN